MAAQGERGLRPVRVKHVRVADTVAAELRRRILAGEFDGRLLPTQHDLAAQTGVGLTSVREAMRILEADGLITIRRGNQGGADVHSPDLDSSAFALGLALQGGATTMGELGVALRAIEPICAHLCADSAARDDVVARLDRLNLECTAAIEDELAFTHLSREFHATVVEHCGNRAISIVVQSMVGLWSRQEELWAREVSHEHAYPSPSAREAVVSAHRRITRSIARGDGAAAARSTRQHLEAAQRYVLQSDPDVVIDVTQPVDRRVGPFGG